MSAKEQKHGTIITDVGVNAVFVATTEGKKVNIVEMGAGDGGGAYYKPTTDMVALKNEVWRGPVGAYEVNKQSPNMITVRAVIPADVGGFTVRELALFTDEGLMVAIGNTPDIEKVVIETGIISSVEVRMDIVLTNAGTLDFVVDSSTIHPTVEDLENHNNDPHAHPGLLEQLGSVGNKTTASATMPVGMKPGDTWWQIPNTGGEQPDIEEPDPPVDPPPEPPVEPPTEPDPPPEPPVDPPPDPPPEPPVEPDPDPNGKEVVQIDLVSEEMPLNIVIDGVTKGISNVEEQPATGSTPAFKIKRK